MKPLKTLVIFCLSLVLIAAGCTDSTDTPSEKTPAQEPQATEQPTPTTTEQFDSSSVGKTTSTTYYPSKFENVFREEKEIQ